MTEFEVTVCRTAYSHNTVKVKAESMKEAEKIALEEAGGHLYNETTADYEVTAIRTA